MDICDTDSSILGRVDRLVEFPNIKFDVHNSVFLIHPETMESISRSGIIIIIFLIKPGYCVFFQCSLTGPNVSFVHSKTGFASLFSGNNPLQLREEAQM